jgi:hypothetical protein
LAAAITRSAMHIACWNGATWCVQICRKSCSNAGSRCSPRLGEGNRQPRGALALRVPAKKNPAARRQTEVPRIPRTTRLHRSRVATRFIGVNIWICSAGRQATRC